MPASQACCCRRPCRAQAEEAEYEMQKVTVEQVVDVKEEPYQA